VDRDRTVLTELFFSLVDLSDEIDESVAVFGNALFRPVGKLELSDGARRAFPSVRHFELAEDVLRHVVLGDGVYDEALVTDRAVAGPVLVAFFLQN
jgi:hypothetical protein